MDITQYQQLFDYLNTQQLPENLTQAKEIKKFRNFSKHFYTKNNFLYKKDKRKDENLLRVIRRFELEPVLYMTHSHLTAEHFSIDIMFNKIRDRYFWPKMYEDIREYVKTCDACQRRGKSSDNQRLHPIPVYTPFYQIGIDFVGPLPQTSQGNKYIIVAMDYLTKWPEARAVPRATAEETTKFIYEEIICRHGCPQKILTDRGTHFKNQLVENLMKEFEIQHLLSTPYHPQTNGLVERFNRTLCESLAKLSKQKNDWDQYISPTLFAYRTSKQSTTKMTPFMLTYGREARLSMDPLTENREQESDIMYDRLKIIIDHLPEICETTRQQIQIQQQKQKD
jgi:Integrase zinc binding domain/Integrase core domain